MAVAPNYPRTDVNIIVKEFSQLGHLRLVWDFVNCCDCFVDNDNFPEEIDTSQNQGRFYYRIGELEKDMFNPDYIYKFRILRDPHIPSKGEAKFIVDERRIIFRKISGANRNLIRNREKIADLFLDYLIKRGLDIHNDLDNVQNSY